MASTPPADAATAIASTSTSSAPNAANAVSTANSYYTSPTYATTTPNANAAPLTNEAPMYVQPLIPDATPAEFGGFLSQLQELEPGIPVPILQGMLERSGFEAHDERLYRLIGISAQRFLLSVADDAQGYARIRQRSKSTMQSNERSDELQIDDLIKTLHYHGVPVTKPTVYGDEPKSSQPHHEPDIAK